MADYQNKTGMVTKIEDETIYIDDDPFLTDTRMSRQRVENAKAKVGDEVIFNFNKKTGELIYLQVKKSVGTLKLISSHSDSHGTFRVFSGNRVILPECGGEMANMFRDSHDGYEEWSNNEW